MQEARYVQPIVEKLPSNHRIVLCKVGEHENVRVLVGENGKVEWILWMSSQC